MAAQTLSLHEKGAEYNLSSQIADSRTAYALSLYAKISNITWNYDAAPGRIAGCKYRCLKSLWRNQLITFCRKTIQIMFFSPLNQVLEMIKWKLSRHLISILVQKHLLKSQTACGILQAKELINRLKTIIFVVIFCTLTLYLIYTDH